MSYIDDQIADECPLITALNARIKLDLVHRFAMNIGPIELFPKDY